MMMTTIDLKLPEGPLSAVAAVSGGGDSMAMLHLLRAAKAEGRVQELLCAHYNHGLRDTAKRDEAHVRETCKAWGVPFVSERGDVSGLAAKTGQSIEMAAREARYDFLSRVRAEGGYTYILTAHTADDNTETILLNLIRGTGLSGLCGIPYRNGKVLRPMLPISGDAIRDYLSAEKIPYITDESNGETIYRRNLLRHEILPKLKELNPSLTDTVSRMSAHLRADGALLDAMARDVLKQFGYFRENRISFPAAELREMPKPIAFRVLREMLRHLSSPGVGEPHYNALLSLCQKGQNGKQTHLPGRYIACREGNLLTIDRRTEASVSEILRMVQEGNEDEK